MFIHLPLYSFSDTYTLFEYVQTPYISPHGGSELAMRVHSDESLIAVSKDDQSHQLYTWAQLDKCSPVGTGHGRLLLCPNANVYFRSDHESCISGLFRKNMQTVREYCRWKNVPVKESYALQRNSNQFLIFVTKTVELKIACSDGQRTLEKRIEIEGHHLVTIQGMCRGYVERFILQGKLEFSMRSAGYIVRKLNYSELLSDNEKLISDEEIRRFEKMFKIDGIKIPDNLKIKDMKSLFEHYEGNETAMSWIQIGGIILGAVVAITIVYMIVSRFCPRMVGKSVGFQPVAKNPEDRVTVELKQTFRGNVGGGGSGEEGVDDIRRTEERCETVTNYCKFL